MGEGGRVLDREVGVVDGLESNKTTKRNCAKLRTYLRESLEMLLFNLQNQSSDRGTLYAQLVW